MLASMCAIIPHKVRRKDCQAFAAISPSMKANERRNDKHLEFPSSVFPFGTYKKVWMNESSARLGCRNSLQFTIDGSVDLLIYALWMV